MVVSTKVTPQNSVLLVMDSLGGEIPPSMGGRLVAATESCILVGCKSESDGVTEIILGPSHEVGPSRIPDFEEHLETPSRRLTIRSAQGHVFLEFPTPSETSEIKIWVNDRTEPDRVVFGVG